MVLLVYLQVIDEQTVCPLQISITWWSHHVSIWLFYEHRYRNFSETKSYCWKAISLKKSSPYVAPSACLFFPFCYHLEPGLLPTHKLLYHQYHPLRKTYSPVYDCHPVMMDLVISLLVVIIGYRQIPFVVPNLWHDAVVNQTLVYCPEYSLTHPHLVLIPDVISYGMFLHVASKHSSENLVESIQACYRPVVFLTREVFHLRK